MKRLMLVAALLAGPVLATPASAVRNRGCLWLRWFGPAVWKLPGPIAGAGIPGLIAGCFGLLGLARRRRRQQLA